MTDVHQPADYKSGEITQICPTQRNPSIHGQSAMRPRSSSDTMARLQERGPEGATFLREGSVYGVKRGELGNTL